MFVAKPEELHRIHSRATGLAGRRRARGGRQACVALALAGGLGDSVHIVLWSHDGTVFSLKGERKIGWS
jgi:hypothetical protein